MTDRGNGWRLWIFFVYCLCCLCSWQIELHAWNVTQIETFLEKKKKHCSFFYSFLSFIFQNIWIRIKYAQTYLLFFLLNLFALTRLLSWLGEHVSFVPPQNKIDLKVIVKRVRAPTTTHNSQLVMYEVKE